MSLKGISIGSGIVAAMVIGAFILVAAPFDASANNGEFTHGVVIRMDGEDYDMAGAPDGRGGATDIPSRDGPLGGSG